VGERERHLYSTVLSVIEPSAKFDDIKIPLREPVHGLNEVSGVLGIPEWWPTGARVAVAIAHSANTRLDEPLIEHLHRELTHRKLLTLRFNFPFAEAGKRASADSPEVLEATFRAAIAELGRDPTAAPAHLFLGGLGLGGKVAAGMATAPLRLDGLFFLGYPLHPQDKPEKADAEHLYRIISPMLFVQGLRDRSCNPDVLRDALKRVGAPTRLHLVEEADSNLRVTKKSGIEASAVHAAVLESLSSWIQSRVDTS
jgi:predicted alpha/beta-hydrolase family hydrolase